MAATRALASLKVTIATSAALVALLALTGCTAGAQQMPMGGGSETSGTSADANRDDVMFAQMMIPHHEQAIEMSDVLLGKTGISAGTVAIAEQITAAQTPEIEQLKQMLADWGSKAGDGMSGMSGMSDGDMQALDAADGAEAERLFLTQMIEHHQGAIDMSGPEIASGVNPDAVALATKIAAAQKIEIEQMTRLLAAL